MKEDKRGAIPGGGGFAPRHGRESNLELFRIIVMLLIIAHHYVVNSGLTDAGGPVYAAPLSAPSLFLLLFGAWGKTGINCFVLITGYFMCKQHITAKKFLRLLAELMFYRVAIQLIFWLTGYEAFTWKALLKMLLPIRSVSTDFTACFLLFYPLISFLNILLRAMTQRQHIILLALLLFIYVFFGTVPYLDVTMNYVSWFVVLYMLSAYVRLYPVKLFGEAKPWGILAGISLLISACSVLACAWLGARIGRNMAYCFVSDSNNFLAVLTAFCAFMFFKNVRIRQSRFINTVAASTFGVLLIHANSNTMRGWLWKDTLNNVGMYGSPWMPVHALCSVIGIFAVCAALDYVRIRFIEKPLFRYYDSRYEQWRLKVDRLEQRLYTLFRTKQ